MTEAELAAIEARAEAVWGAIAAGVVGENESRQTVIIELRNETVQALTARVDVRALVAEVRRLRLVLAAEREACAKEADAFAWLPDKAPRQIAAAIRARQTEGK